jgi:DNA-binding transcriptional regulator YhcF (GntR family)
MGQSGVLAESLLLGGKKEWSVRELAADAGVAPALAHRVVTRLEREALLVRYGEGPKTIRVLSHPRALAELWSREEKMPKPVLRGFLYGASTEAVARKVLEVCPGSAVGGTLAANLYKPVLTRVTPPIRIWVAGGFAPESLAASGFQQTDEGANIEFVQAKGDPWQVHMNPDGLPRVSKWRAWLEIAIVEGRTQELAEALLSELE